MDSATGNNTGKGLGAAWARRLGRGVLGLLLLVLVLAGALLWLAGTPPALRWAVQQAAAHSGGQLEVRGVQGSLYGPLRVEYLRYATESTRVELTGARLDWSPLALMGRTLKIEEFTLQELRVTTLQPSTTPAALPTTLRLPVRIALLQSAVERVVISSGSSIQVLEHVVLAAQSAQEGYRLTVSQINTPWGRGAADLTLGADAPFALAGQVRLGQDASGSVAYQAQASLAGSLARVAVQAALTSPAGRVDAEASLAPFEPQPVVQLQAQATGLNPALLGPDLPQGDIGLRLNLRRDGAEGLTGELDLRNAQAGPWDQARIPLRALTARVAGTPAQMELQALDLDLAQAGRFTGSGRSQGGALALTLNTRNFDPHGVLSSLRTLRLSGSVGLKVDGAGQALALNLREPRYQLQLDLTHQDGVVQVQQAQVQAAGGRLRVHGRVETANARTFELAGALEAFDPSALGAYPAAHINAALSASGHLAPQPEVALRFAIANSRLRGRPLSGQGHLRWAGLRIWDSNIALAVAHNTLALRGALGGAGDQLSLHLQADNLGELDPALAGRIQADATVQGAFNALAGRLDLTADALRWHKDYRVGSLRASGRLDPGASGTLTLQASAQELHAPQAQLARLTLQGQGQRGQHTLQLTAQGPDVDLEATVAGGWRGAAGWSGQVQRLLNRGRFAMALQAPAALEIGPEHFRLAQAHMALLGAQLRVPEVWYQGGHLRSQGEFSGLSVARLQALAQVAPDIATDLVLRGTWNVEARDKFNGRLALWREQGDVRLPNAAQTVLGLGRMAVQVDAVDNRLRATLEVAGERLGRLQAEAQSTLSRKGNAWGLAGDAPLQASADFAVQSLAWVGPLVDATGALSLDGALTAQVRGSGTVGHPLFNGTLEGTRLAVRQSALGVDFQDGRFLAQLQGDVLQLQSLNLRGGRGNLTGQGRLALREGVPDMRVLLKADKLEVLSRPDQLLVLTGTGEASMADKKIQVSANLKADRGLIELPKGDAPSPSSDVVVLGREAKAPPKGLPYALRLDLALDLGEQFFLKGRGLDAQLGGSVHLASVDGALPHASGSIRIVKGSYAAYGQRLEIERGILNFQGPVDNPGLNILAMRKNQEVQAGVAITGSAQAPRVKLASVPEVPDSEKLSWLVLGRGVDSTSGPDFNALQLAAGSLLAAGESVTLQQRIAHAAGLEEVRLKGAGTLEGTVLTLGKRLSSRAYVNYEQSLTGADMLVKINYTLTKRLSLQAQAGAVPTLDLFYTFSFD